MCSLLWSQTLTCSSFNSHLNVFHQMVPLSLIPSLHITSDYCIIHIIAIISMPAKDNIHNFSVQFYLHFFMLYPSTLEIKMRVFFFFFFIIYPLIFFKLDFTGGSDGKASAYNARDLGSIPWVRKISWRRKWQPTPVFLPGKSYGRRSLVDYSP